MSNSGQTTLYFRPYFARSPYFGATLRAGAKAFELYNHMLIPVYYDDPVSEYWHLVNHVTLWDVGVEQVVEIAGPDATGLDA
jgi:glycine cleavage system aminomethyltransferase T